jgi:spermidine/putrescine transport system substrate-binding protein
MKKIYLFIFIIFLVLFLSGLIKIALIYKPKKPALDKELNIFNVKEYLSEEVIRNFEKLFGVKVNLDFFDTDEEMVSAIRTQPDKYDLINVSDDFVVGLKNLKLFSPLDPDKIPNLKYLPLEAKENPYDRGNFYCIPYVRAYDGIAINKKYIQEYDGSASILWDERYKGKISIVNTVEDLLLLTQLYLGYKDHSEFTDPQKLEEAMKLILKQKDLVIGYHSELEQRELLINEKAWIAFTYSTEIQSIKEENPNIEFFAPKEGTVLWADNWCIPKDAPHKEAAHAFLNYLLDPKIAAKNSQDIGALMVNEAMKEYLDPEFRKATEGLDIPQDKEIYKKSRYLSEFSLDIEFRKAINRLVTELGIETTTEESNK